jgi:hypothetical protein
MIFARIVRIERRVMMCVKDYLIRRNEKKKRSEKEKKLYKKQTEIKQPEQNTRNGGKNIVSNSVLFCFSEARHYQFTNERATGLQPGKEH